jgi:hypothetical protein
MNPGSLKPASKCVDDDEDEGSSMDKVVKTNKRKHGNTVELVTGSSANSRNERHVGIFEAQERLAVEVLDENSALSRKMQLGFKRLVTFENLQGVLFPGRKAGCECLACRCKVVGIKTMASVVGLICNKLVTLGEDAIQIRVSL